MDRWRSRTVFWLSLELFILVFAEGFDLCETDGVFDGVFDAFEGDDEADSYAEPEPAIIYLMRHDLLRIDAAWLEKR